ncbi:MAG TPA: metalloregulator ArsR/SmtB family transcription factor [Vicinamibacterales bacterium]|nr:metalloregulator ArsR/SmtB family transcription factor [Vicinamibacterales bacterium]
MPPVSENLQTFKAEFFRALAHPVRIRILEALVRGERTVGQLQRDLDLEQSLVSQQLAILRAKNVVAPRKHGTTVYYTLRDPLLSDLLDVARRIFNRQLVGTQHLLRELQRERKAR